ncbi:nucleoside kinase [Halothermothrix orenii]|uniref:Uridine kinase n=1 Tax=Halothermothrix orenii (strain H 168 / OCM 544 / DSM 9562) TaxID=373903 RepID=B8CX12_HALOH|nr:nucleoside kinase [Halothermothrix orenii]ACL69831.1 uridine kinase [Halothermothrix orenii H 168]
MIEVYINEKKYSFDKGITVEEVVKETYNGNYREVVGAIVNNEVESLNYKLNNRSQVSFLTINDESGNRIYRRSLFFLLTRVIYYLYPGAKLSIEHSLGNGIYCELNKNTPITQSDLIKIKKRMEELVRKDLPINKIKVNKDKLEKIYTEQDFYDKVKLVKQLDISQWPVYELDGFYNYFYSILVPSTGYLDKFDIHFKMPGFILLYPFPGSNKEVSRYVEQPKLASIFYEYEKWGEIINVSNVSELNEVITNNDYGDIIRITEALHEKKIALIADEITEKIDNKRVILIAGPSSSGKTTFAQRLSIQLRVNGLRPVAISTDDYFVDRDKTPRDEEGNLDFEAIEAIDLKLFNEHLVKLLQGEEVEIPIYNFKKGKREPVGRHLKIEKDQPIIIEGIHGLNERLTAVIPKELKYKIYVSALTQLNIDRHNRIPTTDNRLIRRIVRDYYFRGHDAAKTIELWPAVRRGEEKNIFPYQENADIMFNSALTYELSVLKKYAFPILKEIKSGQDGYFEAKRLLEILSCFNSLPDEKDIPRTSILREFIGGSCFK